MSKDEPLSRPSGPYSSHSMNPRINPWALKPHLNDRGGHDLIRMPLH
jgi:hypothetical protein